MSAIDAEFRVDIGPRILTEIYPMHAMIGPSVAGSPLRRAYAAISIAYATRDAPIMREIFVHLRKQARVPRVHVSGHLLQVVYSLRPAPLGFLRASRGAIWSGVPSLAGFSAVTLATLPEAGTPPIFEDLFRQQNGFLLSVTGPDRRIENAVDGMIVRELLR